MKLSCTDLVTYLSDYLDNELDETLAEAAKQHLSTCENCQVVLDSTQKTIFLYKQHGKVALPSKRKAALFDHIAAAFAKKHDQS